MTDAFEYTLTEQDYLAANRLWARRYWRRRRMLLALAATALAYFLIAMALFDWQSARIGVAAAIAAVVAAAIAAGIVATNAFLLPRRTRRLFAQHRQLHHPQRVDWDAARITFTSEQGETRLPWTDFVKWDEDATNLVLFANDLLFYVLPHRAMSAEAAASIRAALTAHGVTKA